MRLAALTLMALAGGCRPSPGAASPTEREAAPAAPKDSSPLPAEPISNPETAAPGEPSEAVEWERFVQAWNSPDPATLALFMPEEGLLILDNPGALVRIERFSGVAALRALPDNFDRARLKDVRLTGPMDPQSLGLPDCNEPMSQGGVHRAPVERFRLGARIQGLVEAELLSREAGRALAQSAAAMEKSARFAVYDLDSDVGFLFGGKPGQLLLLAIDAVIPCSA